MEDWSNLQDSATLIERLKTGNKPPSDVPIINLDISDPPGTANQSGGVESNDVNHHHSGGTESGENGDYGISLPVSPGVTAVASPFIGADPVVEPIKAQRLSSMTATTYPGLSRSARRFSVSTMGLGSNGNVGGHSSIFWKVFSRRSKVSPVYPCQLYDIFIVIFF